MSKVTSKLQVTIPKAIAERYGIAPGDEIEWVPAGTSVLIVPPGAARTEEISVDERLAIFDATTERLRRRRHEVPERAREDRQPAPHDGAPDDDDHDPKTGAGGGAHPSPESGEGGRRRRRPHEVARGWTREELYERGGRKLGE